MNMTPYRYNSSKHRANMYFRNKSNRPTFCFSMFHKFKVHICIDCFGYGFNHYRD